MLTQKDMGWGLVKGKKGQQRRCSIGKVPQEGRTMDW